MTESLLESLSVKSADFVGSSGVKVECLLGFTGEEGVGVCRSLSGEEGRSVGR